MISQVKNQWNVGFSKHMVISAPKFIIGIICGFLASRARVIHRLSQHPHLIVIGVCNGWVVARFFVVANDTTRIRTLVIFIRTIVPTCIIEAPPAG